MLLANSQIYYMTRHILHSAIPFLGLFHPEYTYLFHDTTFTILDIRQAIIHAMKHLILFPFLR